jgi:hypothetical protein
VFVAVVIPGAPEYIPGIFGKPGWFIDGKFMN